MLFRSRVLRVSQGFVSILLFLFLSVINTNAVKITDFNTSDVAKVIQNAKKNAKKIRIPKNKYTKQMIKEAEKSNKIFKKKMTPLVNNYIRELLNSNQFSTAFDAAGVSKKTQTKMNKAVLGGMLNYQKLFIFVSSSVPVTTINRYVADAVAIGSPNIEIVMRGLVGSGKSFTPTTKFISNCLKINPFCEESCKVYNYSIDINPILFRKYKIDRVPAFVYDPHYKPYHSDNPTADNYYKLYGDVSLKFVVNRIKKYGNIQ